MSESDDRMVLMSETLLVYLCNKAYPDDLVQIRWPYPPETKEITFWEPVVTIARPDTPNA
jgi:hypothetical protein